MIQFRMGKYKITTSTSNRSIQGYIHVVHNYAVLEVQYSISINWLLTLILILRLQIHDFKNSKFCYEPAGNIITGNLKIISDSRMRSIIIKGPKYRFPSQIDFNKCREGIAVALNEFYKPWCRREHVECNLL